MKIKKAIELLNIQKSKLLDKEIYKDETWVFQTASFIKDFFGFESVEYAFIGQFKFGVRTWSDTSNEVIRYELNKKEEMAIKFIDDCIETLKHKGLYKKPNKTNFLKNISEGWLIFICATLISAYVGVFYIGYWYGQRDNVTTPSFKTQEKFNNTTKIKEIQPKRSNSGHE